MYQQASLANYSLSGPICKKEIAKHTTLRDLVRIVHYNSVTFWEVVTAMLLFMTLPVTVASAERSFSKMKTSQSYLRSSMGQERLSGLAVLSVEITRAGTMDLNALVNDFAERKARRMSIK
jgi:hypothetical protein